MCSSDLHTLRQSYIWPGGLDKTQSLNAATALIGAGVTLPPAPEPEAIPQWVEEAARVARGQRNTHTRRLTCDT